MTASLTPSPSTSRPKKATPAGAKLALIDLHSAFEADMLVEQRKLCTWYADKIPKWTKMMDRDEKRMFWIVLPPSTPELASLPPSPAMRLIRRHGVEYVPVGHISLDRGDDSDHFVDSTLCSPDASTLTIASLFVIQSLNGLGLANFAMSALEDWAATPPFGYATCRGVTINTLSRKYVEEEGPERRGRWEKMGWEVPARDKANERWYERRGFVKYKEAPRVKAMSKEGKWEDWDCAFMRKEVQSRKDTSAPPFVPF